MHAWRTRWDAMRMKIHLSLDPGVSVALSGFLICREGEFTVEFGAGFGGVMKHARRNLERLLAQRVALESLADEGDQQSDAGALKTLLVEIQHSQRRYALVQRRFHITVEQHIFAMARGGTVLMPTFDSTRLTRRAASIFFVRISALTFVPSPPPCTLTKALV